LPTHTRIPSPVPQILDQRYGDCKDLSLLLHHLLGAAGIKSHLAVMRTTGAIEKALPDFDQFDHLLLFLPEYRGGWFIDPTDRFTRAAEHPPAPLAGREALILDPRQARFEVIRDVMPAEDLVRVERKISVVDQSDLLIEETVSIHGARTHVERPLFAAVPQDQWSELLRQMVGDAVADLEIRNIAIDHLDEPGEPLILRVSSLARRRLHSIDDTAIVRSPWFWERYLLGSRAPMERTTPFELKRPLRVETATVLALPDGQTWDASHWQPRETTGPFLSATSQPQLSDGQWKLNLVASRSRGLFPRGQYAAYRRNIDEIFAMLDHDVVLRRTGRDPTEDNSP